MNTTPAPPLPEAPHRGLAYASVPKILLGLGAFCLLVAAGIFLAVSWSALGVGGRTAVLAGLTLGALAATVGLHRAGLRIAAEAISVVTLGLLTLDVYGAAASGLLSGLGDAGTTVLAGCLLAVCGGGAGLLTRGALPRLVAPQVVSGVGIALAFLGGTQLGSGHPLLVGNLAVLIAGVLAWGARRVGLPVQQWSCLGAAVPAWLGATATALVDGLEDPTLHQLWVTGSGWALLASAAGLLVPAAVLRSQGALLVGASGSAMLVTVAATLPVVGSPATTAVTVAIGVTAVWTAVLGLVRGPLRVIAVAPSALGAAILALTILVVTGTDLLRWADALPPFSRGFLVHLGGSGAPLAPVLVVPAALVLAGLLAVAVAANARTTVRTLLGLGLPAAGIAAAVALAAYDVPLALSAGTLTLVGAAIGVVCARDARPAAAGYAVVALALLAGSVLGAVPSAGLTAVVAGAGAIVGAWLALTAVTAAVRVVGEIALVPMTAAAVVGLVEQIGHDRAWVAVPVLLATGLLAVARPVAWVEVPAAVLSVVLLPVSLDRATDPLAVLSLWLVVAGALCCATALVNASRRLVAPAGAVAWTFATWIRLADLHVGVPEAYTLPLAAALLAAGLLHLHRRPAAGTEVLLPGLLLAIVPSLLLVLDDPMSVRALLLGAGCLVLVLAGGALRWSTPVLTGTIAGVVVVLRELGPYAGSVPQWVWIGLAGLLLTLAGITWERQLRDLRRAVAMIGRLR